MNSALPAAPASTTALDSAPDIVAASGLPADIRRVVLDVVTHCRLWRSERAEVARELCAHFQDGLESGASAASLIQDFGKPSELAPLFTRARKRLRPLWWRTLRRSVQGMGGTLALALALYAILAARFFFASPRITHNYMNELNAPVLATPVEQRGWPMYMQAMKAFGPAPAFENEPDFQAEAPGDKSWDQVVAWTREHASAFETLRRAARQPAMGFVLRADLDADYRQTLEQLGRGAGPVDPAQPSVDNPLLVGVLLPHLGELRRMARWLKMDLRAAAADRDAPRVLADLDALLDMGDQTVKEPFVISQLVACAVYHMALSETQRLLSQPDLLTDQQWQHLAHRVAGFSGGRVHVDISAERAMYEDVLQRFYSDDGRGDGHFVQAAAQESEIFRDFGIVRPRGYPILKAIQPVQSAILPSRRHLRTLLERFQTQAAADDALPPWQALNRKSGESLRVLDATIYSLIPALRSLVGPESPIQNAFYTRDLLESERSLTVTLIALELHHRRAGAWPSSLDQLSPDLLPALPPDPFTGKPLRYLPPQGERATPLLYSVGPDGIDDGGKIPATSEGRGAVARLQTMRLFAPGAILTPDERASAEAARGDRVLWPEPAIPKGERR